VRTLPHLPILLSFASQDGSLPLPQAGEDEGVHLALANGLWLIGAMARGDSSKPDLA
jgi:hypothetical protein